MMLRLFFLHTLAFAYRNYIFARRNIFIVVEMLFWPVMGILSVGLMGGFLELGSNTLAFVLTGAIASGVLQVVQLDVGYSLLYDVWSKSLKHTFLTPASLSAALLGSWIIGIVRGTLVFLILVFFSKIFFAFSLPPLVPTIVFLSGIFWMSLISGIFVWALILIYGQRAEISVWALSYLFMVLCGLYYPVNLLPEPFITLAKCVPLTYFLDHVRSFYGFEPIFSSGLLKGWALNFLYTFAGILFTQMALKHATRTGLLLRLSE